MAKEKIKIVQRAYWGKNLYFQNTTLKIPLVAQPLTNQTNHISFHNGCPKHNVNLKRIDYCPICSQELKNEVKDEELCNFVFKTISNDETVKLVEIPTPMGKKVLNFTKQELQTIKAETEKDILVLGYGKVTQINPQNIGNAYALLPNLNDMNDDGDYLRLLSALKKSGYYLIVNYSDRGNTQKGIIHYYYDKDLTKKEFLMLVNLKDSKDLNDAIEYDTKALTNDEEINGVVEFITTALKPINYVEMENEIEKKKQHLIALKLSGKQIPITQQIEEKPKPKVNGFAMAMKQVSAK